MILFNNKGGLGNSLFIYAFARIQAIKTRRVTTLTDLRNLDTFQLRPFESWIYTWHRIIRKLFIPRFQSIYLDDCRTIHSDATIAALPAHSFVNGYFQSILYFKGYEEQVKQWFMFKSSITGAFHAKFPNLKHEVYGVVHVRRKDYASSFDASLGGPNLILPEDYYTKAIPVLRSRHPDLKLYVISDEPDAALEMIQRIDPNVSVFKGNATEDLLLMKGASALIMANSTFSWWGAFLNDKKADIICPQYFLGFRVREEFPVNIYPAEWTQIAF